MIHREIAGSIKTNWHVKQGNSGRVLNYNSNHPTKQKSGVVLGLLHRAINLSHKEFHRENLKRK